MPGSNKTEDITRLYSTHSDRIMQTKLYKSSRHRNRELDERLELEQNSEENLGERLGLNKLVPYSGILVRKDGSTYRRSYYACHFVHTYCLY